MYNVALEIGENDNADAVNAIANRFMASFPTMMAVGVSEAKKVEHRGLLKDSQGFKKQKAKKIGVCRKKKIEGKSEVKERGFIMLFSLTT